jgi:hypothetical protein
MHKYQPVLDDVPVSENHVSTLNPSYSDGNELDPESFFNSSNIQLGETNKSQVSQEQLVEGHVSHKSPDQVTRRAPSMNDTLVKPVPPQTIPNNTNTDVSKYKVYDNDEDAYNDFMEKNQQNQPAPQPRPSVNIDNEMAKINELYENELLAFGEEEANSRKQKRLNKLPLSQPQSEYVETGDSTSAYTNPTPQQPTVDPFEMMLSTFKRNHEISINVAFKDKIANPDFVKLMMENMDGDIVGFYKKKIMNSIMNDLGKIEEAVEKTIREAIYGEEVLKDITTSNDEEEIDIVETAKKQSEGFKEKAKELYGEKPNTEDEPLDEWLEEEEENYRQKIKDNVESLDDFIVDAISDLIKVGETKTGTPKYKYVDDVSI